MGKTNHKTKTTIETTYELYLSITDIPPERFQNVIEFYQKHINDWMSRQQKQSPNYDAGFDLPLLTPHTIPVPPSPSTPSTQSLHTWSLENNTLVSLQSMHIHPHRINHNVCAKMVKKKSITETALDGSYSRTYHIEEPVSYYLYARSSISKTPLRMANNVGIIDSGYRGQLIGMVDCIYPIQSPLELTIGTRLFQICSPNLEKITAVYLVDTLENTVRGAGGFGSTGTQ